MANPTGKGGFRKGVSGNPGGRKPDAELADVRAKAREHAAGAMAALAKIATKGKSEAAAVAAAQAILDRAYGKPTQPISGDPEGTPVQIQVITGIERGDGHG